MLAATIKSIMHVAMMMHRDLINNTCLFKGWTVFHYFSTTAVLESDDIVPLDLNFTNTRMQKATACNIDSNAPK